MTEPFRHPARVPGLNAVFFIVFLSLLFFGRETMFRDPGTFWHVAAGERMFSTGGVVRQDPFSFTRAGRPWVADQWPAECTMALIARLAGWDGLLLLTAAVLAGLYAWLAARLLRGGLHCLPTCLLLALVIMLGAPQFHVRPLIASIVLSGVTFARLVDVESGAKGRRSLWWLVPLFILWANLHGGVLAGLGTVALCAAGWSALDIAARRFRRSIELILLLSILAAATLVNPYGIDLPRHWFETLSMPLPGLIVEHAPLDLTQPLGWATIGLLVCYTAVLIGGFPRRLRVTWLIPLVWFVLALMRCRNGSLFAVVAVIALADMLPHSLLGDWLRRRGLMGTPRAPAGWQPVVLPSILVAAALAIQLGGMGLPLVGRGWARFERDRWPVELLPRLDEISRSNEEPIPVFNDLNFGGFIIYHQPRMRVFIDDRCALYGTDFLRAYDRARHEAPEQIDRWQRQYGFRHALVETGGGFDRYLRAAPGWTPLDRGPAAALYQRRN